VTVPVLNALSNRYPESELTLAAPAKMRQVLECVYDRFEDVNSLKFAPLHVAGRGKETLLDQFLSKFDMVISMLGTAGTVSKRLEQHCGRVLTINSKPPKTSNVPVGRFIYTQLADELNLGPDVAVDLSLKEEYLRFGELWLADQGLNEFKFIVAVHPGSGSRSKNWGAINYAELVDWFIRTYTGCRIVLIEGEADVEVVTEVKDIAKAPVTVVKDMNLGQLAGVLKQCSLFIGNDSGIAHLSAALGVPTVAIFVSSDETIWRPRGRSVRILRTKKFDQALFAAAVQELVQQNQSRLGLKY